MHFGSLWDIVIYPFGVFQLQADTTVGSRTAEFGRFFRNNILLPVHGQGMEKIYSPVFKWYPVLGALLVFFREEPLSPVLNGEISGWGWIINSGGSYKLLD